jgi:hypothetical protein
MNFSIVDGALCGLQGSGIRALRQGQWKNCGLTILLFYSQLKKIKTAAVAILYPSSDVPSSLKS